MEVHDTLTMLVLCAHTPNGAVRVGFKQSPYNYYVHASCVQEDDFDFAPGNGYQVEFYDVVPEDVTICGFCSQNIHRN